MKREWFEIQATGWLPRGANLLIEGKLYKLYRRVITDKGYKLYVKPLEHTEINSDNPDKK